MPKLFPFVDFSLKVNPFETFSGLSDVSSIHPWIDGDVSNSPYKFGIWEKLAKS